MLAKRIVPCLDVRDGRVVKGKQFKNIQDVDDPVKLGKFYSDQMADELVFYDITASYEKRHIFIDVVRAVAEEINIPFTIGGGISSIDDFHQVLRAGADKVSVNSAAVRRPELIREAAERYGSQCVVLSIDAKRDGQGSWQVYVDGGRKNTGLDAIAWAKQGVALGAGEICINSMDSDGEKSGFDLALNHRLSTELPVPIIASGGAGTMKDSLRPDRHPGPQSVPSGRRNSHERGRKIMEYVDIQNIKFDEKGLVPAIVQEGRSGKVLMMAYMNEESLKKTLETGRTWFYSRSRQKLWNKGEESGHFQDVQAIAVDCDADTLLITVDQTGAACHTGHKSCFYRGLSGQDETSYAGSLSMMADLQDEIKEKRVHPTEKSYTAYLLQTGIDKIGKKIGEEGAEVIIAAKNADPVAGEQSEEAGNLRLEVCKESADLLYHLAVLWEDTGVTVNDVMAILEGRSHVKGNKKTVGHLDKTF